MVLMMVFGLSAVFAKSVVLENDNYCYVTDDENVQKDFSGMNDLDIVGTVVSSVPDRTGEYKNKYVGLVIGEVNEVLKKYFNVFAFSKDNTHLIVFQNLGDGRQLMIYYRLEK